MANGADSSFSSFTAKTPPDPADVDAASEVMLGVLMAVSISPFSSSRSCPLLSATGSAVVVGGADVGTGDIIESGSRSIFSFDSSRLPGSGFFLRLYCLRYFYINIIM